MTQREKLISKILSGTADKNSAMNKYEIIGYWSPDDNQFIAEVPELPGCMADGENQIEALKNVNIAIDEWIETANLIKRDKPKPKGRLMFA